MKMTDGEIWKYLPLANKIADKFSKKCRLSWEDWQDARQEAATRLIVAGRHYNSEDRPCPKPGYFMAKCIYRHLSGWLKRKRSRRVEGELFCESRYACSCEMGVSHGIHEFELSRAMRRIDWRDRDILHRSYGFFGDPETQSEIAKDHGLSRQRINQRQKMAERKLREMLT